MAISALDVALWDLKAKLFGCSLLDLFGTAHTSVAAYGSGGFTTYSSQQLTTQLYGWADEGLKSGGPRERSRWFRNRDSLIWSVLREWDASIHISRDKLAHARYPESICLRWQHPAHAGLGESRPFHPGPLLHEQRIT